MEKEELAHLPSRAEASENSDALKTQEQLHQPSQSAQSAPQPPVLATSSSEVKQEVQAAPAPQENTEAHLEQQAEQQNGPLDQQQPEEPPQQPQDSQKPSELVEPTNSQIKSPAQAEEVPNEANSEITQPQPVLAAQNEAPIPTEMGVAPEPQTAVPVAAEAADPMEASTTPIIPPAKRRKIDSSHVLASVAHFPEFVSQVVVYDPNGQTLQPVNEEHLNSIVWVRISRRYLTRNNEGVVRRKLWGSDVYTDDSDIVAALYHCDLVEDGESDLIVSIKLLPRLKKYQGSFNNELNSRSWDRHHDGISYKIIQVKPMPRGSAEYPVNESLERVRRWELERAQQRSLADLLATTDASDPRTL